MCGIFGIIIDDRSMHNHYNYIHDLKSLYKFSMLRGQDATGLALNDTASIQVLKRNCKPTEFISENVFSNVISKVFDGKSESLAAIGHCRLVTNGSLAIEENNQPICTRNLVGVHNGIVVNTEVLQLKNYKNINGSSNVTLEGGQNVSDTQQLIEKIDDAYVSNNMHMVKALHDVYSVITGTASIALTSNVENNVYLATNNGSLYYLIDKVNKVFVFSSELLFLKQLVKISRLLRDNIEDEIQKVDVNGYVSISMDNLNAVSGSLQNSENNNVELAKSSLAIHTISKSVDVLKRCISCILPSTYPGISFNDEGVCNFCSTHTMQKEHGENALEVLLDKYRKNDGSYDCLVGLSGGRDSSYGIHLLKTKYGMNPLAYTYDWGLTTDQARRNIAKVCGQLGIEHIIRAPDIAKKRRHIRKNINAWLKKPELGMVPLFMAGDKDFYHYGRELRKQYDIDLTIFCSGSLLEQRQFFVGFCGVHQNVTNTARLYDYPFSIKTRLAAYYVFQYVKNLSYINESLIDSIRSFFTSFLANDDFLYLYEYLPWDEKKIEDVLDNVYDWQADTSYGKNQWRMGDGQTAFTNYIFYHVAGFSEFDNFRSNQIREGLLTREEALSLVKEDNKPKWGALQYFAYVVGINLDETLAKINNIPKLY
jgi:glutamine---fructose-6-phosphate transaminase (isomerizing)